MKKIHVFLRHCYFSKKQPLNNSNRPIWWSKEKVFNNFKNTINYNLADYTIIYDAFHGSRNGSFLENEPNTIDVSFGQEAKGFLKTLDIILASNFDDESIIYFVEDDYIHRPNWCEAIIEGLTLPVQYLSLYDHYDKYVKVDPLVSYENLTSKIFVTNMCHWRTTPSTTHTFAVKLKHLKEDILIQRQYSTNVEPSQDYYKFLHLNRNGRILISSIPGYATHCHNNMMSPVIDWKSVIENAI